MWRNSETSYGVTAVLLHWASAITILGLFVLGLWMVDLGYYDPWYRDAPALHKSIGLTLLAVMLFRLAWRIGNPKPAPEPGASPREIRFARAVHSLLYVLIFCVIASGYLISTADGRPIPVFGLLEVPALFTGSQRQANIAGVVHLGLAISTIALAMLHALAALKHHFVDRDRTLLRMLGLSGSPRLDDPLAKYTK